MMTKCCFFFLCILLFSLSLPAQYPAAVMKSLKLAGSNKIELEKAISYFKKQKDTQKIKAIYFLIANMPHHLTASYNWKDASGKIIPFNELGFKNQNEAQVALNKLRQANPQMHMEAYSKADITSMNARLLIDNVNLAFQQWRKSTYKAITFNNFCEYILPYRISVEPYQDWRIPYDRKYHWITETLKSNGLRSSLILLTDDQRKYFKNTWHKEARTEPLPRLGAMQLLFRQKGMCEDATAFTIFSLRSQAIACAENIVPYWATSTGRHYFLTVFDRNMRPISYDQVNGSNSIGRELKREPGKVFMLTFSLQPQTVACIANPKNIPDGLLRLKNYVDVTDKYWPVADIGGYITDKTHQASIVYSCVFNGLKWRPIWWSRVIKGAFKFTKMSRGAVYMPCIYKDNNMVPVAPPIALGYSNVQELLPNKNILKSILLSEEEGYLKFKPNTFYKLYYWDRKWILADKQIAPPLAKQLVFKPIPSNALYLLLPQRPIGMERPFLITPGGKRVWF